MPGPIRLDNTAAVKPVIQEAARQFGSEQIVAVDAKDRRWKWEVYTAAGKTNRLVVEWSKRVEELGAERKYNEHRS